MIEFLRRLFDTTDFPARWHCGRWTEGHGWLHILSDIAIFGAYMAIPIVIAAFIRRRPDVPFPKIFLLFAGFIGFCGATHITEALIFWMPVYRFAGVMKLGTALVSWATVVALVRVTPVALTMRSPEALERQVKERTVELAREKARLEAVLESLGVGVVVVRDDGAVTLKNKVFDELQSADETSNAPQLRTLIDAALAEGSPEDDIVAVGEQAWDLRYLQVVAESVAQVEDDIPNETVVVLTDVTDHARSERELSRSNQELEQFAYVASHDLKEPLRMVVSYTELLERMYGAELSDEARRFVHFAADGARRMNAMVDDLLAVARAGTGESLSESVDLAVELDAVKELLAARIEESHATVTVGSLPEVVGDRRQLRQLLQNLVGNALKFQREGVVPQVHIDAVDEGPFIELTVRDNGIGIDAEHHERIFRIFSRLHVREQYEGTGIGLALCQRIAGRHGGSIRVVESSPQGTTFGVKLPRS